MSHPKTIYKTKIIMLSPLHNLVCILRSVWLVKLLESCTIDGFGDQAITSITRYLATCCCIYTEIIGTLGWDEAKNCDWQHWSHVYPISVGATCIVLLDADAVNESVINACWIWTFLTVLTFHPAVRLLKFLLEPSLLELAYQSLRKSLQHIWSYNHLCMVCALFPAWAIPHLSDNVTSLVNKFVRAQMDFRYIGDWTVEAQ